ncbi:MAG: hypothetical protein SFV18_02700 [Bryobacteraceae bacterium]|nr:hypothetical protein [Bryobacteraceae bacterium]
MTFRTLFLAVACHSYLSAQNLRFGVTGGTALTPDYSTYFVPGGTISLPDGGVVSFRPITTRSGSRTIIGGPTLGWSFNDRFSLESGAIYRRLNLEGQVPTVTWQFPILARYRLPIGSVVPFLEAGPSFRTTGNLNTQPSHTGFSAGTGFDFQTNGFRFSPTLRYTRWARDCDFGVQSKQDQLEILLGVSHAALSNRHPFGDRVALGVAGGFMLNTPARNISTPLFSRTYFRPWLVGPHFDVRLTDRWSVLAEANYRQVRFRETTDYTVTLPDGAARRIQGSFEGKSAVLWQFPVLLKYRFGNRSIQPFVEAGPSFRLPQELGAWLSNYAVTGGAGVRIRWRGLNFEPGLRFSHWGPAHYRNGTTAPNEVRRNQLDSILALTF